MKIESGIDDKLNSIENLNKKYGFYEMIKLYVFTDKGDYLTELDTLSNFCLINDIIQVKDSVFNIDLIKYIKNDKLEKMTDYESFLKSIEPKEILFNSRVKGKEVKLVGIGIMRDLNAEVVTYIINFPNAIAYYENCLSSNSKDFSGFPINFQIEEYNEDGDLFSMKVLN